MYYKLIIILLALSPFTEGFTKGPEYSIYFTDASLRIDFILSGKHHNQHLSWHHLIKEPYWAGPRQNLKDPFRYGEYLVELFDSTGNKLIYSKGFNNLFQEWQTTAEAKKITRAFENSVIIPFPKHPVVVKILYRNEQNAFQELASRYIDPQKEYIEQNRPPYNILTDTLRYHGNPADKVDLAILADGYTANQMNKFKKDAKKLTDSLFIHEPFHSNQHRFNVWLVYSVSKEQGPDAPGENKWKNNVLNTRFYTFGSKRYLTSPDHYVLRDYASHVPYDQIYILTNTERYGGGGMYNYYNTCTADNKYSGFVFVHEFGHGFAGLADEYYTSSVSYEDYFNPKLEPWQPNISSLVDFDRKWKSRIHDTIPIPTPAVDRYKNVVGAFEGAGYVPENMYRPSYDCIMKSRNAGNFCPVCQNIIQKMILYVSDEKVFDKQAKLSLKFYTNFHKRR